MERPLHIILKWKDVNDIEVGYKVYRSISPMDIQNMPSPIGIIDNNETEFIDGNVIDGGVYYYRISAYTPNAEEYSEELYVYVDHTKVNVHDIFGDDSSVMTLQFNGNTNDLGGNYTPIEYGTIVYSDGKFGQSIDFGDNVNNKIDTTLNWNSVLIETVSLWFEFDSTIMDYTYSGIIGSLTSGSSNGVSISPSKSMRVESSSSSQYCDYDGIDIVDGWNHIVVLFNNALDDYPVLYLNKKFIPPSTRNIGAQSLGNLYVGAHYSFGELNNSKHLIDQLRIFNRPITQNEVDVLYDERI